MENILSAWQPRILSVVRIISAFLFMQHGAQKIFGFPAEQRYPFELFSMSGVAGTLELFGGFLLLIGLFTRPVAFLLSGLMAFAYFLVHAPQGFWPLNNGGELATLFSFVFLYFVFAGGGSWSVDCLCKCKRNK
ncbi:integral membrane protein [Methylophaga thiooxydans]|uniref:DoxX subfamily, putative n=2 Tax=Methylophaga thiooxydans TaxID=392484 RepID=C0N2K3_9GAMM|nr:DoxX family protein [Methylophaga thiooxydans]EEF80977.1 DoxX subfamily, putative [Methylophaga thiooxydans DMS010]KGM07107.1 integral membrane protein [Methylophaga thiooxydans]